MIDPAEKKRLLARAQELERGGLTDAAVQLYVDAGEVDQAAKVLVADRRYAAAGALLLGHVGLPRGASVTERLVERMPPRLRRRTLHAAICFARAGDRALAQELYLALGEIARAVEMLQQAGDAAGAAKLEATYARRGAFVPPAPVAKAAPGEVTVEVAERFAREGRYDRAMEAYARLRQPAQAARMAHLAGDTRQAAQFYTDAGRSFDAARCWLETGDTGSALEALLRVPRTDPEYPQAAVEAIRLASTLGVLDFALENFLTKFLDGTPTSPAESHAFSRMAELYIRHDFTENAKRTLARVLAYDPRDAGALERLATLRDDSESSELVYQRIVEEDASFREGGRRRRRRPVDLNADLPELPDLPDLPELPSVERPAREPSATTGRRFVAPPEPTAPPEPSAQLLAEGTQPALRPAHAAPDSQPPGVARALHEPVLAYDAPEEHATHVISEAQLRQIPGVASARRRPLPSASPGQSAAAVDGAVLSARGGVTLSPPELDDDDIPSFDDIALPTAPSVGGGSVSGAPSLAAGDSLADVPPPDFKGFEVGMVLNGRYRFEAKIGQGGMAAVFRAYDLELEEHVAIKIFDRPVTDDGAIKRFKQELSLSRRLLHKNIIRLYDIGSAYGFRFITMELLVGKDLFAHLGPPVPIETGIAWLVQTCDGLQAAHDVGVVHRDIKPHNIFLCEDQTIKVMDFGIAKRQHTPGMTVGNMIAGTPEYMSPEQISGFSSVTHSTDLYALGIVAYQIFTGKVPFAHREMLPLLMMHINERPMPPRQLEPSIPPELERIILRLLEKKPEDRFESCAAVADALRVLWSRL